MKIIIVNDEDEGVGVKDRETLDYSKDIYRVSALWIANNHGQSLLAKRAYTKKHNPGKWGPAVAGTVEEGETYESNITKEADEELGIKNVKLKKAIKELVRGRYKHFTQWFFLKIDKNVEDFTFNKDEVVEIKWFSMEEVIELIELDMAVTLSNELLVDMKKRMRR